MRLLGTVIAVSCLLFVLGCGGDDGGGPNPVTGVDITPDKATIEIGHSTGITAKVTGGDDKSLTWFVNGIENGNSEFGTISQNSPVTYNAPDSLPSPRTVVIGAVSVADTSNADTCRVVVEFTKIFVDAGTGDDDTGTGSVNLPVKSITTGLAMAEAGMTVLVQPGLYDVHNGEAFPLRLHERVSLVGMDWETCIIRGHPSEGFGSAVVMYGGDFVFRKFTLEQGEPADKEWSIAIYVAAQGGLIDSVGVFERARYSVCRIVDTSDIVLQNCQFIMDDGERMNRAFEIITANTGTTIRNSVFEGFYEGFWITGDQDVMIEGCRIATTRTAIGTAYTVTSDPEPDLGGGPRGCAGGNVFTDYTVCGFENETTHTIYAKYNTWDNDPPVEGEDYCNVGTGSIVVE